MKQILMIGETVIYNHSGSADGKYPPMQSPAIVQDFYSTAKNDVLADANYIVCDLFVMSKSNGIFFAKGVKEKGSVGEGQTSYNLRF